MLRRLGVREELIARLARAFAVCTPVRLVIHPWIATVILG